VRFRERLVSLLGKDCRANILIDMVKAMFAESGRGYSSKWYVNIFRMFFLLPFLLEILSKDNFDGLIDTMSNKNKEVYRQQREPVLAMLLLNLSPQGFKKVRNFYMNSLPEEPMGLH
jgi:hypothetical protein